MAFVKVGKRWINMGPGHIAFLDPGQDGEVTVSTDDGKTLQARGDEGLDLLKSLEVDAAAFWPEPDKLAVFSVEALGPTAVALKWTDTSVLNEYRVERASDGEAFAEIAIVPAGSNRYEDSELECGKTYWYQVRSYRASDKKYSPYSASISATTLPCPPAGPVGPKESKESKTAQVEEPA